MSSQVIGVGAVRVAEYGNGIDQQVILDEQGGNRSLKSVVKTELADKTGVYGDIRMRGNERQDWRFISICNRSNFQHRVTAWQDQYSWYLIWFRQFLEGLDSQGRLVLIIFDDQLNTIAILEIGLQLHGGFNPFKAILAFGQAGPAKWPYDSNFNLFAAWLNSRLLIASVEQEY